MPKCENLKYPKTTPANINVSYSKWELPHDFLQELYCFVTNSPTNEKSHRHEVIFTVTNHGQIHFAKNWYCSLISTGFNKNSIIIIAVDKKSYTELRQMNIPSIYLPSNFTSDCVNNQKIILFYEIVKLRPTILHQLLLWDVETILSDADIVFFKNPNELFNRKTDFEVQSDSKFFYNYDIYHEYTNNTSEYKWAVNLGFYKVYPTEEVLKIIQIWFPLMYNSPKLVDQKAFRNSLKLNRIIMNTEDGLVSVSKNSNSKIYIHVLDPMLAVNAGGIYQDGKINWRSEAKRRNLTEPVLCHYFHLGSNKAKYSLMIQNNQIFFKGNQCIIPKGNTFPAWN